MYSLVFGQYSNPMKAKIKGDARFENIKKDSDVIALLRLIRDILFDIKANHNPFMAQFSTIRAISTLNKVLT